MPKTIQIRDIDDDVYAELARRAAEAGTSVPELLRKEAAPDRIPAHHAGVAGAHPPSPIRGDRRLHRGRPG